MHSFQAATQFYQQVCIHSTFVDLHRDVGLPECRGCPPIARFDKGRSASVLAARKQEWRSVHVGPPLTRRAFAYAGAHVPDGKEKTASPSRLTHLRGSD